MEPLSWALWGMCTKINSIDSGAARVRLEMFARAMIGCLLTGQLAMAAIIDQFGLLGVTQQPLTLARSAGLVLLAAGVALVIGGT